MPEILPPRTALRSHASHCISGSPRRLRIALSSIHLVGPAGTRQIPILPELQLTLDAGPLGELSWFARLDGKPMVKESVGNFFAEARKMAGIYGKSGHGVRKAAATQAAENEATMAQMNSIFGWEGDAMASLYTKSANRTKIAAGAIEKLSRTETETPKPSPTVKVGALGRKRQRKQSSFFEVVRSEGLEPPRFYSLPPQGSASTNSATSAWETGAGMAGPDQRRGM
jgi:Phage integrase family